MTEVRSSARRRSHRHQDIDRRASDVAGHEVASAGGENGVEWLGRWMAPSDWGDECEASDH